MTPGLVAALIAAVAVLILVLVLVPAIQSIKKTAQSVSALADLLTNELKPTLNELKLVLAELRIVGSGMAEHSDDIKRFLSALGDSGSKLETINRSVGLFAGLLQQAGTVVTGAKVAGGYLMENMIKRKMKGE